MSASGQRRSCSLKLDLPLEDLPKTKVAGEYEFAGNRTRSLDPQLPPIEAAAGKIAFTESSFTVRRRPGPPLRRSGRGHRRHARRRNRASSWRGAKRQLAGTRALFDHPLRRFFAGQAAYVATVNMRQGPPAASCCESSLQGVASTLPAPLAKSAGEALPLQVELAPDEACATESKLGRVARGGVRPPPAGRGDGRAARRCFASARRAMRRCACRSAPAR